MQTTLTSPPKHDVAEEERTALKRVLCVEDDRDTCDFLRFVMSNYDFQAVETIASAIERIDQEPFDLYVLDNWLPDGSGFLYTQTGDFRSNANVFHYDLASTAVTTLTTFTNEFAIDISPSPDSQWIVFERSATIDLTSGDLWMMRRDGTELQLLVENGLRPSWSQRVPQLPKKVYMSLVRR